MVSERKHWTEGWEFHIIYKARRQCTMCVSFRFLLLSPTFCKGLVKQGHAFNRPEMFPEFHHQRARANISLNECYIRACFVSLITLSLGCSDKATRLWPETSLMHSAAFKTWALVNYSRPGNLQPDKGDSKKEQKRIRIYAHSPFEVPIIPPCALHTSKAHSIIHSRWNIHIYFGTVFQGLGF